MEMYDPLPYEDEVKLNEINKNWELQSSNQSINLHLPAPRAAQLCEKEWL